MKVLSRLIDPEPDYYEKFNIPKEEDQKEDYEPIVKESTHQDLLENWARQTFSENSAEMKLLFESEHDQENEIECNDEIDEVESEESNSRSRKRANSFSVDEMIRRENHEHHRAKRSLSFDAAIREDEQEEERSQPSVQTISSDSSPENFYLSDDSDTIVEDYDEKRMFMGGDEDYTETKSISNDHSMCDICEKYVKVGRAKKSQLRAQLYHVVDVHTLDTVRLDHLNRRYQCESCYKNLSAFVSPCDHISQYHSKDDAEIKFNDRWSEQQISECNRYLKLCFRRGLPVPRGRRVTNGFSRKSNYVINSRKTTETGETSSTTTLNTMHVQKRQQHSFSSLAKFEMSVDIRKSLKEKLLKDVFRADPRRKVLVVDKDAIQLLSYCFKMSELFDEKIIIIEDLTKKREKLKNIDAVYLVHPSIDTINTIISDFKLVQKTKKKIREEVIYKSANIYFLSSCSDFLLKQLSSSHAVNYIKTLKEVNLCFKPIQSQVFEVNKPDISIGIASFCFNLGLYPYLRFHSDLCQSAEFCYRIEQNLDDFMKLDMSLGIESDSHLLILDRSFDLLTPLLHELTFEAMLSENEKEFEEFSQDDDEIWNEIRHLHIAEVIDKVYDKLKRTKRVEMFGTIRDMGKTIRDIKSKEKLEKYITLTECLMETYKNDLVDIISLEQDMSVGFTSENVPIRDGRIVQNMTKLLMDTNVSEMYRLRLILIYILCLPEKIEDYYLKLVEVSGFSKNKVDIVKNMIQLFKSAEPCMMPRRKNPPEYRFNTSRWVPQICDIIDNIYNGSLDCEHFRFLGKQPPKNTTALSARFSSQENRPNKKIVIFIAGGITYSEIREAYRLSKTMKNTQVFIGSDKILTPNKFIEHCLTNKN